MSRHREAPLVDPAHDPRKAVGLRVAAGFLGLGERTLRHRIEEGLLPAYRDGKVYRIRVTALVRYQRDPPECER
jgi:excisionase family DNA binding protein